MPRSGTEAYVASPKHAIEALNFKAGQDAERVMKSTGAAKDSLEPALIEPVDRPVDHGWAGDMAFLEEPVSVRVAESADKNAESIVEVFCNGVPQRFIRGQTQTVKRKFIGVLCRAKPTSFSQVKRQSDDGVEQYVEVPHTAVRYPFSVMEDQNPIGRAWLEAELAAA